jgi:hypothetical protein
MATHCYVYYRIDPAHGGEAATSVGRAQDELRQRAGISGRCLRRVDDAATWMEIYENIADRDAFEATLAAVVQSHGLERWLAPGASRHLECFED